VRVQPDSHRILRAKKLDRADTLNTADRIEQVRGDVVGEIDIGKRAVICRQRYDQEEAALRFGDDDAVALHFLRQQGRCERQLVLNLHLRDIRIGP